MTVKELFAVVAALCWLLPPGVSAAESTSDAVGEVTRRAAAFTGTREPVSLTFRNLSSLPPAAAVEVRRRVEGALRDAGVRVQESSGTVELQVSLSENAGQNLVIVEGRRGDDRQVWMAGWPRGAAMVHSAMVLEKRLLWEQFDPVLDAAVRGDAMIVLSPRKLTLYEKGAPVKSVDLPANRPPSRDPRGMLRVSGAAVRVFLPGIACSGSWNGGLTMDCRTTDEPWPLDAGSDSMLLASFATARNYFDGRVVSAKGARKTLPPFYTAAALADGGWLLAGADGRAAVYSKSFEAAGGIGGWGSDVASVAACGGRLVLATRAEEMEEAVQVFRIAHGQPEALSAPLAMPGPVTALWAEGTAAVAVAYSAETGRYAAYLLTVACGS